MTSTGPIRDEPAPSPTPRAPFRASQKPWVLRPLRRDPRHHVDGLSCSAGSIIDFSVRGLRLVRRLPLAEGRAVSLRLTSKSGTRLRLRARCVWSRRESFLRSVCGLAFTDLSPHQAATLERLVHEHGVSPAFLELAPPSTARAA